MARKPSEVEEFMERRGLHGMVKSHARIFFRLVKSDQAGCARMVENSLYLHVELAGFPDDREEIILSPDTFIPFYAAMFAEWVMPAIRRRPLALDEGMLRYKTADGKRKIPIIADASWLAPVTEWPGAIKKDQEKIAEQIRLAMDGFNALLKDPFTDFKVFQAYDYLHFIRIIYGDFLGIIDFAETANALYRQRGEKEEAELYGHANALRETADLLIKLKENCGCAMKDMEYRPGFELKYYNRLTAPCGDPAAKGPGGRGSGIPFTTENGRPVVDATGIIN